MAYSPWSCKKSDTTERLSFFHSNTCRILSQFIGCKKLHGHRNLQRSQRIIQSCVRKESPTRHITILPYQEALVVKNLPANAADTRDEGSVPGSGRSPGGRHGNPLQYLYLGNPMDREDWQATVHRAAKSWTRLKRLSTHTCTIMITQILTTDLQSQYRPIATNLIQSRCLFDSIFDVLTFQNLHLPMASFSFNRDLFHVLLT